MKNKKSIYILLPLVLLIWGAIGYQFFSSSDGETINVAPTVYSGKPLQIKKTDTFSIKINERDPFSGKIVKDERSNVVKQKSGHANRKIKEEIVWPQIKYKGIVADIKDRVKVYMLIIDGKTHLMKKGEKIDNLLLKDGDRDGVYLQYNNDTKVFYIQ